ncbi:sigma-54 interaction domain-containing protein [Flagellimonas meridianipacifica]|uniref:PAS domain S-box-containing protein n=1 Tax=Flagellimonas meridianipacifica TaxID=1080225 RepID=A0A2T0MJ78_9FLAO|nr:sigma 54-interacting transcriptional regulator [Allomuricauda pacifica]PRX57613.1 PAS domain S-box-containing protein [Allomuricauda pacifica]
MRNINVFLGSQSFTIMNDSIPFDTVNQWLVEELPYEVIWFNENGKIVYANNLFFKKLGYRKSELDQLSIFDLNSTVTEEEWQEHWNSVQENRIVNFKDTHRRKDGKLYEVEVFAQFFSNNGKSYISAIINEITESSFYRNLLNHAERLTRVGGWKLNLQDGSLIVTEEALKIIKVDDKEELLPGNIIHRFKNGSEYQGLLKGLMRSAQAYDVVLETNEKPSRYIRSAGQAILKGKKIFKIIGAYQDVTELQERQNALRLYKDILDNAEDLVYVYNRQGKLIHYSNSVAKVLGFTRKELDNFSIYDLDSSITPEWWSEHMDDIAKNKVLRFEWVVGRKDGTKFQADITANHISFEGEDLNCAVIRDITGRKQRESDLFNAFEEIRSLKKQLEQENEYLQTEIKRNINFDNIICTSESYAKVLKEVEKVAKTDTTVLITGESGTGKELLANGIHQNSQRNQRPLIKVNMATLPNELIESELFGHKKGAFTGATAEKIGKFSLADEGTIFLDEIGEMPLELQSKLLRVLQEGEFDPLGSNKTKKVDVRVIAATNRNLDEMVEKGQFREDLYYRLNVFPIHNIPLRERKEDIPLLAQFFLEKYSTKAGKAFRKISKKTIDKFMEYPFPGNIRELENLIERAVILEEGTTLFPGSWLPANNGNGNADTTLKTFEQVQKDHIVRVLKHTKGRVSGPNGAASILGMKDKTLFAKMKRLGIERQTVYK